MHRQDEQRKKDMSDRLVEIQRALREARLDGWLFYDFQRIDPLAYRILKLDPEGVLTRRWYYLVPSEGEPVKMVHRIEPNSLDGLPGSRIVYLSWQEQREGLASLLRRCGEPDFGLGISERGKNHKSPGHNPKFPRVAMQYSPANAIPYISRVDAGTVELVREMGVEVVSSADLVQLFEAVWTPRQLSSHQYAARVLREIVDRAFGQTRSAWSEGKVLTEHDLQDFILSLFHEYGLITKDPPIVAVNAHSADPHYCPDVEGSSFIRAGDLVLIDLWAKQKEAGSVYADITWTGYMGDVVPQEYSDIFVVVAQARNAALEFVRRSFREGNSIGGWQVDDVARQVIRQAGFGDCFIHRTGHSIGEEDHGNGANLDNLETRDERSIIPRTGFSIEPGIYLEGRFGIRSEINVYVGEGEIIVTGLPIQAEVVPILGGGEG